MTGYADEEDEDFANEDTAFSRRSRQRRDEGQ